MSLSPVNMIINRIKTANTWSPIAVFTGGGNQLDAMFLDTIETKRLIARNDPYLVGVYDKSMDLRAVESQLKAALGHKNPIVVN